MPNWFRKEEDPDNNQGEFKPEEFQKALTTDFETRFKSFQEDQEKKMSPLLEMASQFAEGRKRQEAEQNRKRNEERQEELTVDDDLWITNPAEAHRRSNAGTVAQTQATAALLMRRETLDTLPYYAGDIKAKVDELIDSQPLNTRANSAIIKNAYYTILGQHAEDIREGKLKERTANSSFNGSGSGASRGDNSSAPRQFSKEEQYMMQQFGMTEKDVEKAEQELNYV